MVATGRFCSDKNAFEADHLYACVLYQWYDNENCLPYLFRRQKSKSIDRGQGIILKAGEYS